MLATLAHRVRKVEAGLDAISAEADPEKHPSVQQVGLINFYVPNMKVEAALARLEATGKAFIDFEVLGRAVVRMGELTSDFLSSVNGMRRTVSSVLRDAVRAVRPLVSRVNNGFVTIIKSTLKRSKAIAVPTPMPVVPDPSYDEHEKTPDWEDLMEQYEKAIAHDPTNVWAWIELGRLKVQYETLAAARNCFGSALQHVARERDRSVLHTELGEILVKEGDLAEALREFEAGLAIDKALAKADPSSASLQRDLIVSFAKMAQVEESRGSISAALAAWRKAEAIAAALVARLPGEQSFDTLLNSVRGEIIRLEGG